MREELHALLGMLDDARSTDLAGRSFHTGRIGGRPVVLVLSGIGKVAAATTATLLIQAFDAQALVFTGAAGGLGRGVRVGDVVVARELLQHDMDASPLFPRFEVPLTGRARFPTDPTLTGSLADAARACLGDAAALLGAGQLRAFAMDRPCVHEGLVLSGDRFVSTAAESRALTMALPDALAVEMEGAALAQVAFDFGRPSAVLRSISDRADDTAHVDFKRFVAEVAAVYTARIVGRWLNDP